MNDLEIRTDNFSRINEKTQDSNIWAKHGFQVSMLAKNSEEWLSDVLQSIEVCMQDTNWVMIFGNDNSSDETLSIIEKFSKKTHAKKVDILNFKKIKNVSEGKNNLLLEGKKYEKDFPGILMSDSDDIISAGRARGLLNQAIEKKSKIIVGDWIYCDEKKQKYKSSYSSIKKLVFGPWATLINSCLIPEDGKLFNETVNAHEDLLLWQELRVSGVNMHPADKVLTCYYNARPASLSRPSNKEVKSKNWKHYQSIKSRLAGM